MKNQYPSSTEKPCFIYIRSVLTKLSLNNISLFFLLFLSSLTLSAQDLELAGLWEGTLTIGSSMQGYRMEIYLEKSRKRVKGRVYIHINENRIIETEIKGVLYKDNSIYLEEISFISNDHDDYIPPFLRKFELQWKRSIAGSSLNGYWQETRKDIFDESRQRGQVFLRKVLNNKA